MNYKIPLILGALFCGISVAMGAFGAHALKAVLSDYGKGVYELGIRYHMYHGLALLGLGLYWRGQLSNPWLVTSLCGFILGNLIFTGTLVAIALTNLRWLGAITPIGGFGYLLGWLCFAIAIIKS